MDGGIDWNKIAGIDAATLARMTAGLGVPAGFEAANLERLGELAASGFSSVAETFARQQSAMGVSIASGMGAVAALLSQQLDLARLAAAAITPFPSGTAEGLAAGLSAVSFGASEITRIASASGLDSLAARQGELLADSYESFSASLLGSQPAAVLEGPGAVLAASGSRAASAAFLAGTTALADIASAPRGRAGGTLLVRPNVYDALYVLIEERRLEQVLLPQDEVNREFDESLPSRIVQTGGRVVELRRRINQASLRTSNKHVFRPTTETEFISFRFSQDIVNNEDDFDGFVDRLHKYLFESSDEMRLAKVYVPENPPLVANLATFRHYYSHDFESKSEKERAGSLARVGRVFISMTGTPVPSSLDHWQQSQLVLLERLVEYLEDLLRVIVSRSGV